MKKRSWKRTILNIVFLAVVFGLTLWTVFDGQDLGQVASYIGDVNLVYVGLSVLCVLLFVAGEAVIIWYMLRVMGTHISIRHCCLYSFIGFFYSCLTPSASGGQPMQIIAMRKDKIPVAVSTVVLAIVTITYKMVLVIFGSVIMLVRPAGLIVYLEPVEGIIWLGLGLNVVCVAILLVLVFWPNLMRKMARGVFKIINRIRPMRNPRHQSARLECILSQYEGSAEFFRSHKRVIWRVFELTVLQRIILFFITWLTYRGFALSGEDMPTVVSLQAMISVATDMLPLPGGMGISENLFLEIFAPIFGTDLVLPGMVVSRGISFYTQLVICGIMTVFASFVLKRKEKERLN